MSNMNSDVMNQLSAEIVRAITWINHDLRRIESDLDDCQIWEHGDLTLRIIASEDAGDHFFPLLIWLRWEDVFPRRAG